MGLRHTTPKAKRDQGGGRDDARRKEKRAHRILTLAPQASKCLHAQEGHAWREIESLPPK
jgi:hypothetical protein